MMKKRLVKSILFMLIASAFSNSLALEYNSSDPTEAGKYSGYDLNLSAIAISKDESLCIINGIVMEMGSEIFGNFITEINESGIVLTNTEGKTIKLTID